MSGTSNDSLVTQRNRPKFVSNGYKYTFDKYSSNTLKKFWRCDRRLSDGCKARLHTDARTNQVSLHWSQLLHPLSQNIKCKTDFINRGTISSVRFQKTIRM